MIGALLTVWLAAGTALAQVPQCNGDEPARAAEELAEGRALMQQAIADAREGGTQARILAARALAHFDQQCRLGDANALSERGAALMLMGEPLRSAQSYDAFLRARPLRSLDGATRRIVESNLQLGEAIVEIDRGTARLFVDGLDFGPLPRTGVVHLPEGEHQFEARRGGDTLAEVRATLGRGGEPAVVQLSIPRGGDDGGDGGGGAAADLTPWYLASSIATVVSLAAGFVFLALTDERERVFDRDCKDDSHRADDCQAVSTERDAAFATSVAGFVLSGLGAVSLGVVVVVDLGD